MSISPIPRLQVAMMCGASRMPSTRDDEKKSPRNLEKKNQAGFPSSSPGNALSYGGTFLYLLPLLCTGHPHQNHAAETARRDSATSTTPTMAATTRVRLSTEEESPPLPSSEASPRRVPEERYSCPHKDGSRTSSLRAIT